MNLTEKKLREIIRETINELDENPCWDGYTQLGTKMKDGKEVPNCVPVSEANVIRSLKEGDTEYQAYFRKELEKTGKSSPADMTDDEKREFFSKVDKGWNGKTESKIVRKLKEGDTEYQAYFRKELEKTGKSSPADMTDDEKRDFFSKVDKGWTGKNESVNEGKKWYNDRKKWENDRKKLSVSDDDVNWDKDSRGKLISFWDDKKGNGWISESTDDESVNELFLWKDVDSEMKKLGIRKIPISSQGEKILKGLVKEKFLDDIDNTHRLVYFVQSLGDQKFGYRLKNKPLSPLVDRFWNDIDTFSISLNGNIAAYSIAMDIKDMKRRGNEIDSPYEMLKDYFKNIGMDYNRSRTFELAWRYLRGWMNRNNVHESVNEAKFGKGDTVRVIDRPKYVFDKTFWNKSGYVKDVVSRDTVLVTFPNGRTILVDKRDLEMNENQSIKEGNAFGMAVTKAKQEGKKEFEFNGKKYKVKKGSYEKNEAKNEKEN